MALCMPRLLSPQVFRKHTYFRIIAFIALRTNAVLFVMSLGRAMGVVVQLVNAVSDLNIKLMCVCYHYNHGY